MFRPRKIESHPEWSDADGIKIYTISATGSSVNRSAFAPRLADVKAQRQIPWNSTPAFAIFHEGATALYLMLAWWGNDNELFTSVSVKTPDGWVEDPSRFSFCLWDLEVMWQERNFFLEHVYCSQPSLETYRAARFVDGTNEQAEGSS